MTSRRLAVALAAVSVLALPASAQAAGYQDAVLGHDPLAYLRLDEPLGASVAQDASPNDRDGAYAGAVTLGGAAPFVDAVTAPALAAGGTVTGSVDQSSRTLELWVNPNRLGKGEQAGIVAHGDPAAGGWAIGIGSRRKLTVVTGGSRLNTKITLASNVWTAVAVTWSDKIRIHVNGALKKQLNGGPASGSGSFVLGGNGSGSFTGRFSGRLDEAALFDEALSAADIRAHFLAAHVPVNTTPPAIDDATPTVGETLTVAPGAWSDAATATRAYQWQRCDENGEDCADIAGATQTTHAVAAADECGTLQVLETVTNTSGAGTAISELTGRVGPCPDPPPVNTALPAIAGTAAVGQTLTASPGTWSHDAGATRTFQWRRCDEDGASCADIAGATGTTYLVGAADDCMRLQVAETVTNASGNGDTAVSDPTGNVGPCVAPGPDPDPDPAPSPDPDPAPSPDPDPAPSPEPDPAPSPEPDPTPAIGQTPDPGGARAVTTGGGATTGTGSVAGAPASPAANAAATTCQRLIAGRKRINLRRYGVLRLKATKNACLTAPIAAVTKPRKGVRLKSVRYRLDGKRVAGAKRPKFAVRLRPARLTVGRHTVKVRVTPRSGRAKTFTLRLRVAVA